MTGEEWLSCADPTPMLEPLRLKATERKLRLFALACCFRIKRLITHPAAQQAMEFAEKHVEIGLVRRKGRRVLEQAAQKVHWEAYNKMFNVPAGTERSNCLVVSNAIDAAAQTLNSLPIFAASYASSFSCYAVAWEAQAASGRDTYPDLQDSFKQLEKSHQAQLLRDIFGNPFHTVTFHATWRTSTVTSLAQRIYDDRRLPSGLFDNQRMGVLADALEEAGCDNVEILGHLRGGGEHVRGCWVIDCLLGKE